MLTMTIENLEITITANKFPENIKRKLKSLSSSYYEDPFLENVIFVEIATDKKAELNKLKNIEFTKANNAVQIRKGIFYDR